MTSATAVGLDRILVLDDKRKTQEDFAFPIQIANRTPVLVDGPLGNLQDFLSTRPSGDAAVADYHLTPGHYANFDGDELVSAWYKQGFPSVLCTSFATSNAAQFRRLRRWIPVVMSPHELDPDSLMRALELTRTEIQSDFVPARRPWRALVRFVEYDESSNVANAKLPGWTDEVVAFRATDLPEQLRHNLRTAFAHEDEYRCYASANLGSERNEDLYACDWEL